VVRQKLCGFKNGEALSDKDKLVFSKRKLLRDVKPKVFDLSKGECFSVTGIKKKALDLTAEMIASYGAPPPSPRTPTHGSSRGRRSLRSFVRWVGSGRVHRWWGGRAQC
jgi:hypothetical protein